jgi:beta-glucuronidase
LIKRKEDKIMTRIIEKLDKTWRFSVDKSEVGTKQGWYETGLPSYKEVSIPHTFNIEPETLDYRGTSWYEYRFTPTEAWSEKRVRIQFNGIYRDADIWLNGKVIGSHYNSGFTTFTIDTKGEFKVGVENLLIIKVQNHYSKLALPYGSTFDWADDGGIFREVCFIITGQLAFDNVKISAKPLIPSQRQRYTHSKALWKATAALCSIPSVSGDSSYSFEIYEGIEAAKKSIYKSEDIQIQDALSVAFPEITLDQVALWHFDFPQLYTAIITLKQNGVISDQVSINFGFREFLTENHRFLLNGEYVRLCGTEWMPGSNPTYGNAEPTEYMISILKQLKESNCIFTRFHWQQDEAIYHWCDKNGMLVQEEVPHWGKAPEEPGTHELAVSKQQIDDMMTSHYNHPSIIMWGMGNELNGQDKNIWDFMLELKDYIKSIDPDRQVNYMTNTILQNPSNDATRVGDVLMINEYIGTWHGDLDTEEELNKIVAANENRPIVISEFGLCEPTHVGGDKRRSKMFIEKMNIYSKFPEIAGIINFCLNDYRTQMGEEGAHLLRRRVHGSTDIFAEPKPSYYVVQNYCSPIQILSMGNVNGNFNISLQAKDTLPSYIVDKYYIVFEDNDGKASVTVVIPTLKPGEQWDITLDYTISRIQIFRPNGFLVEDRYVNS